MAHCYCSNTTCSVSVINPLMSTIISYGVSAGLFAYPLFNALGADVKNIASLGSTTNISLSAIGLVLAIFVCGYISSHERHRHPLMCVINACGVPGLLIAIMTAAKL